MHGYNGLPNSTAAMTTEVIDRMHTKLEQAKEEITLYTEYEMADAEHVVIAYGGTARSAIAAVKAARAKGIKAGLLNSSPSGPSRATSCKKPPLRLKL